MKKNIFIVIMCTLSAVVFSQIPESFKYQSVLRDNSGAPLAEKKVGIQITILSGPISSLVEEYKEDHSLTTDKYGIVNISIGEGTPVLKTISSIDWASKKYFLRVAVDVSGGKSYVTLGTSQLLSVPYAQAAERAISANKADTAMFVKNLPVADPSSTNELQNLKVSSAGDTLSISSGNYVIIPGLSFANPNLFWKSGDKWLDIRDKQLYSTRTYGKQVWMTDNLNFWTSSNSWNYENDSLQYSHNGRLYTWATSNAVCPSGWHLPSDGEWKEFEQFLGMTLTEADKTGDRGTNQGTQLKAGGSSNFNAKLAGYRLTAGTFGGLNVVSSYWTSTAVDATLAWPRAIDQTKQTINRESNKKDIGFSVRCVKN